MPRNKIETRQIADNIIRHNLYAIDNQTQTMGNRKLIDPIFRKIRIRGQMRALLRTHISKSFARFLCLFVPSRNTRHKIKHKINKWARI